MLPSYHRRDGYAIHISPKTVIVTSCRHKVSLGRLAAPSRPRAARLLPKVRTSPELKAQVFIFFFLLVGFLRGAYCSHEILKAYKLVTFQRQLMPIQGIIYMGARAKKNARVGLNWCISIRRNIFSKKIIVFKQDFGVKPRAQALTALGLAPPLDTLFNEVAEDKSYQKFVLQSEFPVFINQIAPEVCDSV